MWVSPRRPSAASAFVRPARYRSAFIAPPVFFCKCLLPSSAAHVLSMLVSVHLSNCAGSPPSVESPSASGSVKGFFLALRRRIPTTPSPPNDALMEEGADRTIAATSSVVSACSSADLDASTHPPPPPPSVPHEKGSADASTPRTALRALGQRAAAAKAQAALSVHPDQDTDGHSEPDGESSSESALSRQRATHNTQHNTYTYTYPYTYNSYNTIRTRTLSHALSSD